MLCFVFNMFVQLFVGLCVYVFKKAVVLPLTLITKMSRPLCSWCKVSAFPYPYTSGRLLKWTYTCTMHVCTLNMHVHVHVMTLYLWDGLHIHVHVHAHTLYGIGICFTSWCEQAQIIGWHGYHIPLADQTLLVKGSLQLHTLVCTVLSVQVCILLP